MITYDAIVVGGGPAGSACARQLTRSGRPVAVFDRATFPRDKLCAGWLSPPVWDALGLSTRSYPGRLWSWQRCRVTYRGREHLVRGRGYFIRRSELDAFLLRSSGATVVEGHRVRRIRRDGDGFWVVDERARARCLVGAGGTHCPVARLLGVVRPEPAVLTREIEFPAPAQELAARRPGEDGEPELWLHDDLDGYSWNVPKTDWVNLGSGTLEPGALNAAWQSAQALFERRGRLPARPLGRAGRGRGHAYYRFHPQHLRACEREQAFLVGDALGLAHPVTAEGILAAVLSGRMCAEAIAAGRPERYGQRLAEHPVFVDYRAICALLAATAALRPIGRARRSSPSQWRPRPLARLGDALVARGFAQSFVGRQLPASRVLVALLRGLGTASQSPIPR